jgi:hypothetical protein
MDQAEAKIRARVDEYFRDLPPWGQRMIDGDEVLCVICEDDAGRETPFELSFDEIEGADDVDPNDVHGDQLSFVRWVYENIRQGQTRPVLTWQRYCRLEGCYGWCEDGIDSMEIVPSRFLEKDGDGKVSEFVAIPKCLREAMATSKHVRMVTHLSDFHPGSRADTSTPLK